MSRPLIVRSIAEQDLVAGHQYYESVSPDLGVAFVMRVDDAINAIALAPEGFRKRHREFRMLVLKQFPYGVFYLSDGRMISIVAILPLMREPAVIRNLLGR